MAALSLTPISPSFPSCSSAVGFQGILSELWFRMFLAGLAPGARAFKRGVRIQALELLLAAVMVIVLV